MWLHEIKHDGFRILPRKQPDSLRLWSRQGKSWHRTFEQIAGAVAALPVRSIVLDGEAVAQLTSALPSSARRSPQFLSCLVAAAREEQAPSAEIHKRAKLAV